MNDSSQPLPSTAISQVEDALPALAIWTVALAIFSLLTFGFTSLPAIVCGHLSIAGTARERNAKLGRQVALTGLVIGYIGVALLAGWIIALIGPFSPR